MVVLVNFVYFINENERIFSLIFFESLNNLIRESINVGLLVVFDFCYICKVVNIKVIVLMVECLSNRFFDIGFVNFRGFNKIEDFVFDCVMEFVDGNKFENVIFNVLEVIVIFIKDFFGVRNFEVFGVFLVLGNLSELVKVVLSDIEF